MMGIQTTQTDAGNDNNQRPKLSRVKSFFNGSSGLDIKHLVYMPVGQVDLKIDMPCKSFHEPNQLMYTAGKISK